MELCNNMEITNPYAIRMLLNQPKTTPYIAIFLKLLTLSLGPMSKHTSSYFILRVHVYQIWGQPILRKYFQLAAITMIIIILGYIINAVNLAATLSLSCVIIKSWTNVKKHKLLFYSIDVYQIWGQPVLKKYSQLAAITI